MHLKNSSHALVCIFGGVVNRAAGFNLTRINSEEAELADKGIGCNLEGESCKRLLVGRMSYLFLIGLGINALNSGNIRGSGHIVNNCVKQKLNTLVAVGSAANNGNHMVSKS